VTEPTLHPLVQRAMLSTDVTYEVLPCEPDVADTAAFCAHYGFALEQAANTILVSSKKVAPPKYAAGVVLGTTLLNPNELTKLPNVIVVEGLAKPK
jgi:prolyl-tRNA editing enzyme YbaK/EbsC (Cys-tRNA(Pro) deacylase)